MKKYILSLVFTLILILGAMGFYFTREETVSQTERRKLYPYPKLTFQDLESGDYLRQLEQALQDHFIFRDDLKHLQYQFKHTLLGQTVVNERFIEDDYIFSLFAMNQAKPFKQSALYYQNLHEQYFQKAAKQYYSYIPNKDFYSSAKLPQFDLSVLADYQQVMGSFSQEIKLDDKLTRDHFYRSDLHWRHEKIAPLAFDMLQQMSQAVIKPTFTAHELGYFVGSDGRALASKKIQDALIYQTWPELADYELIDLVSQKPLALYDTQALDQLDPYNLYLAGPQALLSLRHVDFDPQSDATLYLIRDSYASSLAPYLTQGFKRIILIDMRYIDQKVLGRFIDVQAHDTVYYLNALLMLSKPELLR
ncbi:MAG TPA: hypothetical protein VIG45_06560 [Erysipelothrix sp.]